MDFFECCEYFTSLARSNTEELSIGKDISPIPELKIIFDGYGYDEETDTEGGNFDIETYALFVHKDALTDGFKFPEHEKTPWCIVSRPDQEICLDIFYKVSDGFWTQDYPNLEEDNSQTFESLEETLIALFNRYYAK